MMVMMTMMISWPNYPRNSENYNARGMLVAPPGFEPGSQAPKACMLDRYTTGLPAVEQALVIEALPRNH